MDATQEVINAAKDRASALAAGDAKRLGELLHEQFTWTTHVGQTLGRSEYIRRNTGGHIVWRSQELTRTEVVVVVDAAVLRAEVIDEVVSAENQVETFRMPVTQMWIHSAGGWKCLAGPRRSTPVLTTAHPCLPRRGAGPSPRS